MSKSFAVLGLGRFGKRIARSLYDMGADVIAVDGNPEQLEKVAGNVTYSVEADLTDAEDIKGIGIENTDVVIVAMGSDLKASIMSVMVSKEVGVPYVVAKAADERMGTILKKVGADKVIFPEEESGERTARILCSESFIEFFDIDKDLSIIEMKPKKEWIGKNLIDLALREKYKANIVAVKENGKMHPVIDPKKELTEDTDLLIVIEKKDIKRLG